MLDLEFMRLALMGQKLGHQVFIVIEQLSEIDVLLAAAEELGVVPMAGIRIGRAPTAWIAARTYFSPTV